MLSPERRAKRLARCYPRGWRARYGEEFVQLLIDDFVERPFSLSRTADVMRCGLAARVTASGLGGEAFGAERQLRASLGIVGCSVSVFLAFGIGVWSQLTIGWQWSAPGASATRVAMLLMSAAVLGFMLLALVAAIPLLVATATGLLVGRARRLAGPLLLSVAGVAVLVLGARHFGHGWPGTGGHRWADRGLVPADVAAFFWAASLWVTTYWAHPGSLLAFPTAEVVWMAVSPLALATTLVGAVKVAGRLELSRRTLRFEACLAVAGAATMALFLAGAGSWVLSGGPAPRNLFRVGTIDFLGLTVMGLALLAAFRASQRGLQARLSWSEST